MTHTIYYRESETKGKIGCPATAVNTVKHCIGVVNCNYCSSPLSQNYFLNSRWFMNRHSPPSPTRIAITTLFPPPGSLLFLWDIFKNFFLLLQRDLWGSSTPCRRKPPLSQEWQPSLSKSLLQLAVLGGLCTKSRTGDDRGDSAQTLPKQVKKVFWQRAEPDSTFAAKWHPLHWLISARSSSLTYVNVLSSDKPSNTLIRYCSAACWIPAKARLMDRPGYIIPSVNKVSCLQHLYNTSIACDTKSANHPATYWLHFNKTIL